MQRVVSDSEFAARLAILLDRLNWSRAQLARKAGVDKSVAQRWVAGKVVPGEASLGVLTAAIQAELPGFTRAHWRMPSQELAVQFGLAPPAQDAPASPAAALFPRIGASTPEALDLAAARYAGSWLLLHASVQPGEAAAVVGYLAEIAPRDGMLWMSATGGVGSTWRAEGPLFTRHRHLYLALEDVVQGDSLAFGVLDGVTEGKAMVLDGIGSSCASSLRGPVSSTRLVALRLDGDGRAPAREDVLRRLARLNGQGLAERLPEQLAACFRHPEGTPHRSQVLLVTAERSLACSDVDLADGLAPVATTVLAALQEALGLRG
jgi:transcriptional regulator with XRE-family HTH domain